MQEIFSSLTGLSIERLNSFCRVAEHGSIKEAADSDPTRQSQFSRQIKDLESALGVELFDRRSKKWALTEQGRRLVVICRVFFQSLTELQASADMAQLQLKIGSGDGVLSWLVAPHLESIRKSSPKISFECRNLRTNEIVRQLREGEIDIGILRHDADMEGLEAYPYSEIDYILLVPREILPGKSAAGIELLKELPIACLSGGGQFQRYVKEILKDKGLLPVIKFEAGSFVLLSRAMRTMQLAGVLPTPSKAEFSEEAFAEVKMVELNTLKRQLVIAVNPEVSINKPQIGLVVRQLRDAV